MAGFDFYEVTGGMSPDEIGGAVSKKIASFSSRSTTVSTDVSSVSCASLGAFTGLPTPISNDALEVCGFNPTFDSATGRWDGVIGAYAGVRFVVSGSDTVKLDWTCNQSSLERFMVYIDGKPLWEIPRQPDANMLTPTSVVSTTSGSSYQIQITFPDASRREVEIIGTHIKGLYSLWCGVGGVISKPAARAKIAVIGDSFQTKTAAISNNAYTPPAIMQSTYDCNILSYAIGGTGYVTAPAFIDRIGEVSAFHPDFIVVMGSVNDDGKTGIDAAVSDFISSCKSVAPRAKIVVFGPQPTNDSDTISANRESNVIAVANGAEMANTFVDMVGFSISGSVSAFSTSESYTFGDYVSHLGAIWKNVNTVPRTYSAAEAPGKNRRWELITATYGTGNVSAATGDGSRDVMLSSDGVHPTESMNYVLAGRMAVALNRFVD